MAMLYAIQAGVVTQQDLEPYKKSFKQSKKFKNFLLQHPDHEIEVQDQVIDIKCANLMKKINLKNYESERQR